MRRQFKRRVSKAARFAQGLGLFTLILVLMNGLALRYDLIDTLSFMLVSAVAVALAVLVVLFALFGLWRLWHEGARAGGASLRGIVLALLAMAPFAYAGVMTLTVPIVNDVSTDPENPPQFPVGLHPVGVSLNLPAESPKVSMPWLQAAPADLNPYLSPLDPDQTENAVNAVAADLGWKRTGTTVDVDGRTLIFSARTTVLRFTDDIAVRLRAGDDGTLVDVRSASRFGTSDLGTNARRIQAFEAGMEKTLSDVEG